MARRWRLLALALAMALVACGPRPAPPGPSASELGELVGQVSIGPLQPVERVGVPAPTPRLAVCTARALTITPTGGPGTGETVGVRPDCTYQVTLAPGRYQVALAARGIEHALNLPATIQISSGQTTRLDVRIDTGMR